MATTRTMNIYGYGYGPTPVTIQASLDGTQVFSGEIPTLNQDEILLHPDEQVVLFSTEIPMEFSGNANVAITVDNGYINYNIIKLNYAMLTNPKYTQEQLDILSDPATTQSEKVAIWSTAAEPAFNSEELAFLELTNPEDYAAQQDLLDAHGAGTTVSSGADDFRVPAGGDWRPVVYIDGIEQIISSPREFPGTYSWGISAGSTLYGNVIIRVGKD
mgnify:CR=1 FL=1